MALFPLPENRGVEVHGEKLPGSGGSLACTAGGGRQTRKQVLKHNSNDRPVKHVIRFYYLFVVKRLSSIFLLNDSSL